MENNINNTAFLHNLRPHHGNGNVNHDENVKLFGNLIAYIE